MRLPRFRIRTIMIVVAAVSLVMAAGVQLPSMFRNVLLGFILILGIPIGLARMTLHLVNPRAGALTGNRGHCSQITPWRK